MCTFASQTKPIQLPLQYLGKWHEIQRLSNSFQKGQCSTATYSLQSPGVVGVLNKELLWVLQWADWVCQSALLCSLIRYPNNVCTSQSLCPAPFLWNTCKRYRYGYIHGAVCAAGRADLLLEPCPLSPALQSLLGLKISFTINGYSSNLRLHLKNIF